MASKLGVAFFGTAVAEDGAAASSGILATAMDAIPFLAIATVIALLILHFKQVKHWMEEAAKFIIKNWKWFAIGFLMIPGIGPLLSLLVLVASHWKQVKKIAVGVFHAIIDVVKWYVGAYKTEFNIVKTVTLAVFNALKTAFTFLFNFWRSIVMFFVGIWRFEFNIVKTVALAVFGAVKTVVTTVFDAIKTAVGGAFRFISGIFTSVFGVISWPFKKAADFVKKIFNWIVGAARWVTTQVKSAFRDIADPVKAITDALGITGGPSTVKSHGRTAHALARGGPVRYMAPGGPLGTDTVPAWLTPGEFIVNRMAAQRNAPALAAINAGASPGAAGAGNWTIQPGQVIVKVGERVLAEAVVRYTLRRAARGPSSLVGGSLTTGFAAPTPSVVPG